MCDDFVLNSNFKFSKPGIVKILLQLSVEETCNLMHINSLWNRMANSNMLWRTRYTTKILGGVQQIRNVIPDFLLSGNGLKFLNFEETLRNIEIYYPDRSWFDRYHIIQHIVTDYFKGILQNNYFTFSDPIANLTVEEQNDLAIVDTCVRDHYLTKILCILMDMDIFCTGHQTKTCKNSNADIDRFIRTIGWETYLQGTNDNGVVVPVCPIEERKKNTEYFDCFEVNYKSAASKGYCFGIAESILKWISLTALDDCRYAFLRVMFSHNAFQKLAHTQKPRHVSPRHVLELIRIFENGESALTYAVNSCNVGLFKYLYKTLNLDVNQIDWEGFTPLTCALIGDVIAKNPRGPCGISIDRLPKRQQLPQSNLKPTFYPVFRGNLSAITLLTKYATTKENAIDLNVPTKFGDYPIFLAYQISDRNVTFNKLLEIGVDLEVKNSDGKTIIEVINDDSKNQIQESSKQLQLHKFYLQVLISVVLLTILISIVTRYF